MSTMKKFGKYLILFLLFYVFVSVMSYAIIRSNYTPIESYTINCIVPTVEIIEAKVTRVGGYVQGKIYNNDTNVIDDKYIRLDFISESGNRIISKYVELNDFKPNEEKEFKVNFSAENIQTFGVELVEAKGVNEKREKLKMKAFEAASTLLIIVTSVKLIGLIL